MRFRKLVLGGIAAAVLGGSVGGCVPYGYHHHYHHNTCGLEACLFPFFCMAPDPVPAAVGAALVTIALMQHDAHRHYARCGCPSRMYRGRQVWWYNGHWEFYDRGRWYAVPDCPPPY